MGLQWNGMETAMHGDCNGMEWGQYLLVGIIIHSAYIPCRGEWDKYLSPEGMLVPPGYLEAPLPSSEVWAKYCVDT